MTYYPSDPQLFGAAYGRHRAAAQAASSGAANSTHLAYLGAPGCPVKTTSEPPLENAGIRAGEIIGYRAWVLEADGHLHGMFMADFVWRPNAVEHAPQVDPRWGKGLHAFKTMKKAQSEYCFAWGGRPVVYGEIALWGEVIEHERGYRAEYASIKSLLFMRKGISIQKERRRRFLKPSPLAELYDLRVRYGADRITGVVGNVGETKT